MVTQKMIEFSQLAFEKVVKYSKKRFVFGDLFEEIKSSQIYHALIGPRGVGKTILLLQLGAELKKSFYLSADQLEPEDDLFEIVKSLSLEYKIKYVLIDEIHAYRDFARALKAMSDFLDIRVLLTSSAALSLEDSTVDLSRRAKIHYLLPFSFREYVFFQKGVLVKKLSIKNIFDGEYTPEHLLYGNLLKDYISGGLYPFALREKKNAVLFENILKKIIYKDIPRVSNLRGDELKMIEKLLAFIGKSSIDGINISSISKNLSITKYKAEEYVGLLTKTFILNPIYPSGANVIREPKILMNLPFRLLYLPYEQCIGGLREDCLVEWFKMSGLMSFNYLKSTRGEKTPDFLFEESPLGPLVIEVGGKNKGHSQFKGIDIKFKKMIVVDEYEEKKQSSQRYQMVLFGFIAH